jgi:hypothetical protein
MHKQPPLWASEVHSQSSAYLPADIGTHEWPRNSFCRIQHSSCVCVCGRRNDDANGNDSSAHRQPQHRSGHVSGKTRSTYAGIYNDNGDWRGARHHSASFIHQCNSEHVHLFMVTQTSIVIDLYGRHVDAAEHNARVTVSRNPCNASVLVSRTLPLCRRTHWSQRSSNITPRYGCTVRNNNTNSSRDKFAPSRQCHTLLQLLGLCCLLLLISSLQLRVGMTSKKCIIILLCFAVQDWLFVFTLCKNVANILPLQ